MKMSTKSRQGAGLKVSNPAEGAIIFIYSFENHFTTDQNCFFIIYCSKTNDLQSLSQEY